MSEIQSVLFDKKKWSLKESIVWYILHFGEPLKEPHVTKNFIRFRKQNPKLFSNFKVIDLKNGVKLTLGFRN